MYEHFSSGLRANLQVVASIDMGVFHAERGRRKGAKKTRNVDAFQKMYMDAGQSNADAWTSPEGCSFGLGFRVEG